MKKAIAAAVFAFAALVLIGQGQANSVPTKACETHQEYFDSPNGMKDGDMYRPGCAVGPGHGGPVIPEEEPTSTPTPTPTPDPTGDPEPPADPPADA